MTVAAISQPIFPAPDGVPKNPLMNRLHGKVALVTGGARGIGYAIAERFADEGASVAILALHQDSAARAADQITRRRGSAIAIAGDVCEESIIRRAIERVTGDFGQLDIMVNNAGIIAISSLLDTSTEAWDRLIAVNLRGVFLGCREAARQMIAQGTGGRIISASSGAGRRGNALIGAYATSKFGVIGLTQSLAVELAPHQITVNAYCPGHVTSTPMWELIDRDLSSLTGQKPGSARLAAEGEAPLGRAARPEEIAAAVAFLASDEAGFITGESLLVDGGLVRF
jgi:meso-butanediol dehydrogenase/(S,S)-butanediol dehydrogenase/diacetyl reductase